MEKVYIRKILLLAILYIVLWQGIVFAYTVDGLEYTYRKKITIQTANVDSDLSNFPLYVKLTADVEIGNNSNADGFDIRFTQSDGTTLLKYERESWTGGAGDDVTADFWVNTNVDSGDPAATDIYIYYRSTDTADGADPANVWDANFVMVQHMKDATTSTILDSTSNSNDGTKKAANEPVEATGKIYNGQDFDGNEDYIEQDVDWQATLPVTMSVWIYPTDTATVDIIYSSDSMFDTSYNGFVMYLATNEMVVLQYGDGTGAGPTDRRSKVGTTAVTLNAWNHVVGIINGATDMTVYINGASTSGTYSGTGGDMVNSADKPRIGHAYDTSTYEFTGKIDEVRISGIARTAAWIKFENYNMNENDQELTWGDEESAAVAALPQMIINIL